MIAQGLRADCSDLFLVRADTNAEIPRAVYNCNSQYTLIEFKNQIPFPAQQDLNATDVNGYWIYWKAIDASSSPTYNTNLLGYSSFDINDYTEWKHNVKKVSINSISCIWAVFRSYFHFCKRFDVIPHRKELTLDKTDKKKTMEIDEIKRVLSSAKNKCLYDYTLLMLAYSTGMRISELLSLTKEQIHFDTKKIEIIKSKGNKGRFISIPIQVCNLLKEFMESNEYVKGQVFFSYKCLRENKKKGYKMGDILPPYVNKFERIFKEHLINGGVDLRKSGMHTWRHSYASHLCAMGEDLAIIRDELGHSSISVTSKYIHASDKKTRMNPLSRIRF